MLGTVQVCTYSYYRVIINRIDVDTQKCPKLVKAVTGPQLLFGLVGSPGGLYEESLEGCEW